jgi:hypothetical protein
MNYVQKFMYIREAVRRVELVRDRMSFIILRGNWFHIIVLNAHAQQRVKLMV